MLRTAYGGRKSCCLIRNRCCIIAWTHYSDNDCCTPVRKNFRGEVVGVVLGIQRKIEQEFIINNSKRYSVSSIAFSPPILHPSKLHSVQKPIYIHPRFTTCKSRLKKSGFSHYCLPFLVRKSLWNTPEEFIEKKSMARSSYAEFKEMVRGCIKSLAFAKCVHRTCDLARLASACFRPAWKALLRDSEERLGVSLPPPGISALLSAGCKREVAMLRGATGSCRRRSTISNVIASTL